MTQSVAVPVLAIAVRFARAIGRKDGGGRAYRSMARRRLPGPIFHYIDGAADDEVTYRRNTEAYERCDLVPNVLAGVEDIDMSTAVMGQKLDIPLFCPPTALQRLFPHAGERAVAKAAEKFGTMFGVSSLGTVSIEEIGAAITTPKMFQLYLHKDRGLTNSMIERGLAANFDVLALTVDTITGGNRERDLRTGFTSPPRLTLKSLLSFAMHPRWAADYFMHEKFELPQLKDYVKEGSNISVSVGDYFSTMLDQSMNWLRIPTITTTDSDGSRPPVPIDRDQCGAGAEGA